MAVCLAIATLHACAGLNSKPDRPALSSHPDLKPDFSVEVLRASLREYCATFAADVEIAATSIQGRSDDPSVRRQALLWRLRAIPEMRKACFRAEPVAALVDAWTLARQMEDLFTTGAGASAFGSLQSEAVAVSRRLVVLVLEIKEAIVVSPEASSRLSREVIDPWVAGHPLQDLNFVRESPAARLAEYARDRGDMFQSIGSMEATLADLSYQARIYLAELSRHMRGEIDLLRADVLPDNAIQTIQGDLHSTAASVDRIATTVGGVPDLIRSERQAVLDEIVRQRIPIRDAITAEREAVITAMTGVVEGERNLLLHNLEQQRLATLQWATTERQEAVAAMQKELARTIEALRIERAAATGDLGRIVDALFLRVLLLLVAAIIVAPLVAHAYARVWPRRSRSTGSTPD